MCIYICIHIQNPLSEAHLDHVLYRLVSLKSFQGSKVHWNSELWVARGSVGAAAQLCVNILSYFPAACPNVTRSWQTSPQVAGPMMCFNTSQLCLPCRVQCPWCACCLCGLVAHSCLCCARQVVSSHLFALFFMDSALLLPLSFNKK